MRIVKLYAENVKRLKVVAIAPDGSVVRITGANASGKTSLLDAIYWALAGKRATSQKPVRDGEESAVIKLDLGEIRVTRKFSAEGSTSVVVESLEGARFPSPQALLDKLLGELSFDPLSFSRAEPKKQLDTLRGLVRIDVDIDALDGQNARDYEERTEWNRTVRSMTDRTKTLKGGVDEAMDVTPIDQSVLVDQIAKAVEHNGNIAREREMRKGVSLRESDLAAQIQTATSDIERMVQKKRLLQEQLASLEAQRADWPEIPDTIDVVPLRQEAAEADRTNQHRAAQRRQREAYAHATSELSVAHDHADRLTRQIEDRNAEKARAIAAATMPVPGLSFGAGGVLFNGLPFDQASTAEQIRVSMGIAMALNPKLRVVLVRDASLLDATSLAIIEEMAETHDFQIFLEMVDTGSGVGILLEDGSVVSVDGEAVKSEAVSQSEAAD